MDLGVTGKVALVAGGGRGIGAAVARRLAAEGARVAVLSRNADDVNAVAHAIGGMALPCDLTDAAAIDHALERLRTQWTAPLIVVHTAAAHFSPMKLHNIDDATARQLLDVDLQSAVRLVTRT